MSAKFITGFLTAAALIATMAAAAPAQAGNNDNLKKFIAGAATLYLLHELADGKKGKIQVHGSSDHGWKHRKPPLPRHCIRKVGGKKKTKHVATRHCLKNNYRAFHRLPKSCKTTFRRNGHKRKAYSLRCLKNHGFRVARRH